MYTGKTLRVFNGQAVRRDGRAWNQDAPLRTSLYFQFRLLGFLERQVAVLPTIVVEAGRKKLDAIVRPCREYYPVVGLPPPVPQFQPARFTRVLSLR